MGIPIPASDGTTLKLLEGKSFEEVLSWLDRALHGKEALPSVIPGESPEIPILRRERNLSKITRSDLRESGLTLVRRFVKKPEEDDAYVAALLRLVKGFGQTNLVTDLHLLASNPEMFKNLPENQIKSVLFALLDLKAPLSLDFWKDLTGNLPPQLSVIPVSALLGHGPESAARVLPVLPDDEAVADSLYVIVEQHSLNLSNEEKKKLATAVETIAAECSPKIQQAIEEWTSEQVEQDAALPDNNAMHPALDSALAAYNAKQGRTYEPQPSSPKLLQTEQAA